MTNTNLLIRQNPRIRLYWLLKVNLSKKITNDLVLDHRNFLYVNIRKLSMLPPYTLHLLSITSQSSQN